MVGAQLLLYYPQGLYSLARSLGAVMFENHALQEFELPNGSKVLEQLYGFPLIKNSQILAGGSAATGFDCGVPPEPSVCITAESLYVFYIYIYVAYYLD